MPRLDVDAIASIGVREIDLVVFVIRNPLSIGRTAESVRKTVRALRQVNFVVSVAIHAKRMLAKGCEAYLATITTKEVVGGGDPRRDSAGQRV